MNDHIYKAHTNGTRDKKVFAMCLLGALGTTYRVIWGICRFVETPRCRIFCCSGPGTPTPITRDIKG